MINVRDDKIILFMFTGEIRKFLVNEIESLIIEILKFGRQSFSNDRKYYI